MTRRPLPLEDLQARLIQQLHEVTGDMVLAGLMADQAREQIHELATREALAALQDRRALAKLLLLVLRAIQQGLVQDPTHYRRGEGGLLALHPESLHNALLGRAPDLPGTVEMRRLFRAGRKLCPDVVLASQRLPFGATLGRRRGVLLSEPHAHALALLAR